MTPRPNLTIVKGPDGASSVQIHARGMAVLDDPEVNRGTAFTTAERDHLGLHGLLPSVVETIDRADRPMLRAVLPDGLGRREVGVPHPAARQQRGALLPVRRRARARDAADRLHPDRWHGDPGVQPSLPSSPRRLPQHRRHRRHRTRPRLPPGLGPDDIDLVVASDAEAILGIGDWGVGGIDISIGKLAVYTVAAGIDPQRVLAVGSGRWHEPRSSS